MEAARDIIDSITIVIGGLGIFALAFIGYAITAVIYGAPLLLVLWLFGLLP